RTFIPTSHEIRTVILTFALKSYRTQNHLFSQLRFFFFLLQSKCQWSGKNPRKRWPSSRAPQGEGEQASPAAPPPRQPRNLQGLLRFAMDAAWAEYAPHDSEVQPMDEESKKFLEEALKSLTIDVVQLLQKQIRILKKVEQVTARDDVSEYLKALDMILEYVDNIDFANVPAPQAQGGRLRTACHPLPEQPLLPAGHPGQRFVPKLLEMIEKDPNPQVVVKALYALSGIVRANEEGYNQLVHYNGLVVLLDTLKQRNDKFISKTAFLLTSLCKQHPDLRSRLVFLDYVPVLIQLISSPRSPSHEHALALLVTIVEENSAAEAECKNPKYNLKDVLQRYNRIVRNQEEYWEEEQYCKRLFHMIATD
ncbi:hypothetical protein NQ318_015014, partial [Aromia moschata]